MIYTTGTIAVSGNTLTGTGTNFTAAGSLIRVGCTVIAMSSPPQVFQITGISNGTVMTVSPAASPALAAGTKYSILLSDSLSVDGLAQDIAETFAMYQRNISGFADVMNGTGDVTIAINGAPVTVPGQKSLAKKDSISRYVQGSSETYIRSANSRYNLVLGNDGAFSVYDTQEKVRIPVSIQSGGTGATTAAGIRTNAGLGSAATFDVDLGSMSGSNTMVAAQLHRDYRSIEAGKEDLPLSYPRGVSCGLMTANQGWGGAMSTYLGAVSFRMWSDKSGSINSNLLMAVTGSGLQYRRSSTYAENGDLKYTAPQTIYSTQNTTKGSDGAIKAASPVVKLFHDGCSETNEESEGCTVIRLDVGKYLIENCIGMNADASWGGINGGFDIPKDRNGQTLIWLDYEVNADGSVLIQTYHRTYPNSPVFARNEIEGLADGDPVDIPADQFVSVRVEMPQDSIWNRKMATIEAESEVLHPQNEIQSQEE